MSLWCFDDQSPLTDDCELSRITSGGHVADREHTTGKMADAVVVGVDQQDFRIRGLTINDDVEGAELSVLCEALYPRSRL